MRGCSVAHRERETSSVGAFSSLTRRFHALVPWWLLLVLGIVAVAIGLALILGADAAARTVFLLLAAGFIVSGLGDVLVSDEDRARLVPMLIGGIWIAFGIVVGIWGPRYPEVLVVAAAGLLLLSGFGRILTPLLSGERVPPLTVVRGIVEIAFGTTVFFVSGTTLQVVAIVFGVRVLLSAVRFLFAVWQVRRRADAAATDGDGGNPPTKPIEMIPPEDAGPQHRA